jgi:hypothetical protein
LKSELADGQTKIPVTQSAASTSTPYKMPSTTADPQKSLGNDKIPPPILNQGNTGDKKSEDTTTKQSDKKYPSPVKECVAINGSKNATIDCKNKQKEGEKPVKSIQTTDKSGTASKGAPYVPLNEKQDTKTEKVDLALSGLQCSSDIKKIDAKGKVQKDQQQAGDVPKPIAAPAIPIQNPPKNPQQTTSDIDTDNIKDNNIMKTAKSGPAPYRATPHEQQNVKSDTKVGTAPSGNQAKVDANSKGQQGQKQTGDITKPSDIYTLPIQDQSKNSQQSQSNKENDNRNDKAIKPSDTEKNKISNVVKDVGKLTSGSLAIDVNGQMKLFNCSKGQLKVCFGNDTQKCHFKPGNSKDLVLFCEGVEKIIKGWEGGVADLEKAANKLDELFGPSKGDQFSPYTASYMQRVKNARL